MRLLLVAISFLFFSIPGSSQECSKPGNSQGAVLDKRLSLLTNMDTSAALVIKAADAEFDVDIEPYRQEPFFLSLTGIEEAGCKLIVIPRGLLLKNRTKKVLLFVPSNLKSLRLAVAESDTVLDEKEFEKTLAATVQRISVLYYYPVLSLTNDWINGKISINERSSKKLFEQEHPGVKLKPAGKLLAMIGEIKTGEEIRLTEKAIAITGDGLVSAMKQCRPGMFEYELQAAIEYEAKRKGAECMAFASIIGSGTNSLIFHYDRNCCEMKKGSVVVMDVGARYGSYCADITRTIPVSGKFSPEQRSMYDVLLGIQKALIGMVRPGITMHDLDERTGKLASEAGFGRYNMHGVTHSLGLRVHDPSTTDTLKPGMIITIEPGFYVSLSDTSQPAALRGCGFRIEDDVLVTRDGHRVLSENIPKEPAEIERLMKKKK